MSYTCEYCNKQFNSISNINYHKKTARYCLDIQNKNNIITEHIIYECNICNKQFNRNSIFESHFLKCKQKNEPKINDEENKKLKKLLEESKEEIENLKKIIEESNKEDIDNLKKSLENVKEENSKLKKLIDEISEESYERKLLIRKEIMKNEIKLCELNYKDKLIKRYKNELKELKRTLNPGE